MWDRQRRAREIAARNAVIRAMAAGPPTVVDISSGVLRVGTLTDDPKRQDPAHRRRVGQWVAQVVREQRPPSSLRRERRSCRPTRPGRTHVARRASSPRHRAASVERDDGDGGGEPHDLEQVRELLRRVDDLLAQVAEWLP
jgi:hypothetical protein